MLVEVNAGQMDQGPKPTVKFKSGMPPPPNHHEHGFMEHCSVYNRVNSKSLFLFSFSAFSYLHYVWWPIFLKPLI